MDSSESQYKGNCNEALYEDGIKEVNINVKKSPELCKFFLYGHCWKNSDCKFIHSETPLLPDRFDPKKHNEDILYNNPARISENGNHNHGFYEEIPESEQPSFSNKVCKYFKAGYCKNSNCSFQHSHRSRNNFKQRHSDIFRNEIYSTKTFANRNSKLIKSVSLCKYYKKGFCRNGDQCKFYHPKNSFSHNNSKIYSNNSTGDKQGVLEINNKESTPLPKIKIVRTIIKSNQNIFELNSLSDEEILNIRNKEIEQLKKRFTNHSVIEGDKQFKFEFQPSDPDWPFDLRILHIEASFPERYPVDVCKIEVLHSSENIPSLLLKHLNRSIFEWFDKRIDELKNKNQVEMMFRPFLKWFDRNLEELFIAGLKMVQRDIKAKEAGIDFVPPEALFRPEESQNDREISSSGEEESNECVKSSTLEPQQSETPKAPQQKGAAERHSNSENQGTKILFSNLELTEGAAAMTCSKVSVSLQCIRCKTVCNLSYVAKKNCSHKCTKCSKDIAFIFAPSTLHPYSNVLGTMTLLNCKVVDVNLVECDFLVDCLNCSKQVSLNGIHYSQIHKMWCLHCNFKMIICIGGVKFQASKESMFTGVKYVPAKKIAKQKDPVVKEGEPLPQFGACKHYKKSYRWLRFPCCGRIYPCDVCHDEKEQDHEMKFASRMLCGFCAKEQPYSREKPCIGCSANLTKKSGAHWEGGKGCRNKIQMCREDKQKYSGASKTVSRKAQSNKAGKKA